MGSIHIDHKLYVDGGWLVVWGFFLFFLIFLYSIFQSNLLVIDIIGIIHYSRLPLFPAHRASLWSLSVIAQAHLCVNIFWNTFAYAALYTHLLLSTTYTTPPSHNSIYLLLLIFFSPSPQTIETNDSGGVIQPDTKRSHSLTCFFLFLEHKTMNFIYHTLGAKKNWYAVWYAEAAV